MLNLTIKFENWQTTVEYASREGDNDRCLSAVSSFLESTEEFVSALRKSGILAGNFELEDLIDSVERAQQHLFEKIPTV